LKLIITEAHYKLLLESLIDEARPSEHFDERQLDRFINREFLEVGYDEGGFNYIEVGIVNKDSVLNVDYSKFVDKFRNYDLPEGQDFGIKIENLRIPVKEIEISRNYIEYFKNNMIDSDEIEKDIRMEMKRELSRNLRIPFDKVKLNDDVVNKRLNSVIKREIYNFLYSKVNRRELLVVDKFSKSYGNQTYLIIRNNVMVTIFLGIANAFRNPKAKLRVDHYFENVEAFENYYKTEIENID
jgi:hypothetical protein